MYVVKKPLNIGGKRRVIGEVLKDEEITSKVIVRSGLVARIDSGLPDAGGSSHEAADSPSGSLSGEGGIFIPLSVKDPSEGISISPKEVYLVFWLLQLSGADAARELKGCESASVLQAITAVDSRKAVKAAASERLAEISGEGQVEGNEGDA